MSIGTQSLLALTLAAAVLLSGCAEDPRFSHETQYIGSVANKVAAKLHGGYDADSYWDGDEVKGPPSIVIHLGEQRAYFYKGKQLVGVSTISSGREGLNTVTGNFHIIQKDKDHVSSRFGDYIDKQGNIIKKEIDRDKDPMPKGAIYDGAKMPFFMRIVGGTGMHEGFLPGYPASHGCIRMPGFMAENFFYNVSVGTPVTVTK
jgi:lipoprotein-anchoring transpeptidase ErfK/SrfK